MSTNLNKPSTKKKIEAYYVCTRCNKSSVTAVCPCQRGSCEAKLCGKVTTTTEITIIKSVRNP